MIKQMHFVKSSRHKLILCNSSQTLLNERIGYNKELKPIALLLLIK